MSAIAMLVARHAKAVEWCEEAEGEACAAAFEATQIAIVDMSATVAETDADRAAKASVISGPGRQVPVGDIEDWNLNERALVVSILNDLRRRPPINLTNKDAHASD